MNSTAGPFFVGDGAIDVINGVWDRTGFLSPRGGFKWVNGDSRWLSNVLGISGLYRYIRYAAPPFYTSTQILLAADSQWVWPDSSITDTLLGFKLQPIGASRGQAATTSGSKLVVGSSTSKWLQYIIPKDPFFGGVIDSASYFRITTGNRLRLDYVLTDDTALLNANAPSTVGTTTNYKLFPAFSGITPIGVGVSYTARKMFSANGNQLAIADSTKPVWVFDGDKTTASFVVDSGRVYANTTTILRDNTKAWFPNQWRGYWVRFNQRIMRDWGAAIGADSAVRSPWCPIIANDDTSLTLRFDPVYGDAGASYYIMALPIERISAEHTVTSAVADTIRSTTTGYSFPDRDAAITSYPLSIMNTSYGTPLAPAPFGQLKMVGMVHSDSIVTTESFSPGLGAGERFVLIGNFPIIPRAMALHFDRTWYVDISQPNRVYYSEPLEPGNVGPFNYIDVFPRGGDAITNLASYQDQLLVYKNNSIARIVGDNPSNLVALPFLENMGTPGINSRTSFGGDEFFYHYPNGIFVLREFNPVLLSAEIKTLLDTVPSSSAKNASIAIFKNNLWFSYPTSSSGYTDNNRLVSRNIYMDSTWSRHAVPNPFSVLFASQIAGDSIRLYTGNTLVGGVYSYDDTSHLDANAAFRIKLTYKTGWLSLSTPELRKQLRGFQLAFDADTITGAAVDVDTMLIYKDQSATPFDTLLFNREGQLNNYVAKDVNRNGLGRFFQLEMRVAPRSLFKLYAARYKFANVGERQ